MDSSQWLIVGVLALVGLAVGSFLNVVIARVPEGDSVVSPRSRCPRCRTELSNRDNIPLLSWALLAVSAATVPLRSRCAIRSLSWRLLSCGRR